MNIYPTDEQLEKIRKWEVLNDNNFIALMKYVRSLWEYADYGYWQQSEKNVFIIATAGWSGNEDIISALQENVMFWTLYWYQSQRGGKYIFCPQSVHLPAFEKRMTELEQENACLREELYACQSALKSMVYQYLYRPLDLKTKEPCENVYQHDFMSAGEEACDYLVRYGLASWTDKDKYAIRFIQKETE